MHSIWSLIQALSFLGHQYNAADVGGVVGADLKLVSENEYNLFFENKKPLVLEDGVIIGRLDVRESKENVKKPLVILDELRGNCITLGELKLRFSSIGPPIPPSNPVPSASITRYAMYQGKRYVLGFRFNNPNCLYGISQQDN